MQRSHKIRLYPNNSKATYFAKACGISRLAFNWGLAEWKRQYSQGERPSAYGLKKKFNAIKREQFPFVSEITKWAPERAFFDLDRAFKNFFQNKRFRYPKFKKKGRRDSFYISGSVVKLDRKRICIPKIGWVRMAECLRFSGKIQSVTISKRADRWFASIAVDIPDAGYSESQVYSAVGIDLGVKRLATLSDGIVFENPATTKKFARRLRRSNKALARKQKWSRNSKKQKLRLARLHQKIADYRSDAIHKFTSFVADRYSDVCIEDLNVVGMVKNRKLARAISDVSFGEIRRQLEYKSINLHVIDRWFPSTKLCANCGQTHEMPLSKRVFECDCGFGPVDRDLNASQNILRQGLPWQPVERPALALSLAIV